MTRNRRALALVCCALVCGVVSAQDVRPPSTEQDATTLTFKVSPDQDAANSAGQFVVERYRFDALGLNAVEGVAVVLSVDLQKPTPNAMGFITVDLTNILRTITPNTIYIGTVTTVGPGGAVMSAPSNAFSRGVVMISTMPRPASEITVLKR